MLSAALKKIIYDLIPTNVTVDGIAFVGNKRYANQHLAEPSYPSIVLNYSLTDNNIYMPFSSWRKSSNKSEQTFTYATGTNDYDVTYYPLKAIESIVGTVLGVAYTFDPAEYTILDTDTIRFLGPTYPDDTTTFEVTYTHKLVRQIIGSELYDNLSVNIYAEDYYNESNQDNVNGIKIAVALTDLVKKFFKYFNRLQSNDDIVVRDVSDVRDLDELMQEPEKRRRQFDVHLAHVESEELTVETIEEIDWQIT